MPNQPCPKPGHVQVVLQNTTKTLSLSGGQRIFVGKNHALVYINPGEALPELAFGADDWQFGVPDHQGNPLAPKAKNLVPRLFNAKVPQFYACPHARDANTIAQGPWQIFANLRGWRTFADNVAPTGNTDDCEKITLDIVSLTPVWPSNA
ncbi:hypothetical protein ABW21_db0208769 [Orbilia brochopaga]|nr:hypothetical protein ABW21_db0208769 [Drechslerella brochopaga]